VEATEHTEAPQEAVVERAAPSVGESVVYVDPVGVSRPALVTAVFGSGATASINVVIVSNDAAMRDQYGQQIGRETSIVHKTKQSAHGRYWRHVDE
jgi:hypothetical protein